VHPPLAFLPRKVKAKMRIFKERTQVFDIPEDPDKGWVEIIYLNPGKQQEVVAKGRRLDIAFIDGKQENRLIPDEILLRDNNVDTRIVRWGNMFGEDDKEMKCNRANKIKFICEDGSPEFLAEKIEELDVIVKEEREKEVKNLPASLGGSPE